MQIAGATKRNEAEPVRVRLKTPLGTLVFELMVAEAPLTCASFLRCVDEEQYGSVAFYRVVRVDNDNGSPAIQVIQTTILDPSIAVPGVPHESTTETGLKHVSGTVSLARAAAGTGDPRSIFICIGDHPGLDAGGERNADRLGFAAFAKVAEGMEVVKAIHAAPTVEEAPDDYLAGQLLAEPVPITAIWRDAPADGRAGILQELANDYWEYRLREYPTEATAAGDKRYNRVMERTTLADHARRAAESAAMLARAEAIDPKVLSLQDALTLAMLRRQLVAAIEAYHGNEQLMPQLFPFGFQDAVRFLVDSTPLDTQADFEDFVARLQAAAPYFDGNMECLIEGLKRGYRVPRAILPRVIALLDAQLAENGLVAAIAARFAGQPPPGLSATNLANWRNQAINAIQSEVLPSLRRLKALLQQSSDIARDTVAICDQPSGESFYSFKVRQQTSCDLSPDEVHTLGLEETAELTERAARIAGAAGFDDPHAYATYLQRAIEPNAIALLERVRALAKRIDGLLPRLFGRFPRMTYGVSQLTREQSHGMPPAYAQPSAADGSMPGIFWLTALPERCPSHLLVPLTLHEAWPGHLMQIAYAQELASLPAFRRHALTDYNGYIEGWALYCERLGYDLGLYDNPADAFGHISFELWRAARLAVDTGLHCKGWSREKAIEYLATACFLPRDTVEAEVDRYIGMPAQALSYKIGERAIRSLRVEAQSRLGSRFAIRSFHDQILSTGPVALDDLQRHMRAWIARVASE